MGHRSSRPCGDEGAAVYGAAVVAVQTPEESRRTLRRIAAWYRSEARDLPWRGDDITPWGVLVSEVMLQQTGVDRVAPVYVAWMQRWPTPDALARDAPGEAVRAWGRLGYPRRALRLHAAAAEIVDHHGGQVPDDHDALLALPGVGDYTAAAVGAFAFGRRVAVLDTNVRRVHARLLDGAAFPASATPGVGERQRALAILPTTRGASVRDPAAAEASIAVMELGALVCVARVPRCGECPVRSDCAWVAAGSPPWDGPPRRGQSYAGTDRQCRGALLAVLRESRHAVPLSALEAAWPTDAAQRMRALDGLVADGLVVPLAGSRFALP
jgi:A/G-specific adenine glycosylase